MHGWVDEPLANPSFIHKLGKHPYFPIDHKFTLKLAKIMYHIIVHCFLWFRLRLIHKKPSTHGLSIRVVTWSFINTSINICLSLNVPATSYFCVWQRIFIFSMSSNYNIQPVFKHPHYPHCTFSLNLIQGFWAHVLCGLRFRDTFIYRISHRVHCGTSSRDGKRGRTRVTNQCASE